MRAGVVVGVMGVCLAAGCATGTSGAAALRSSSPTGPAPVLAVADGGRWAWQAQAPTLVQRTAALTPAGGLAVLHVSDGSRACPA